MSSLMARRSALLAAIALTCPSLPAGAQSPEQFYPGKTIKIIVALGVGGDYDEYARLVGRSLGKYMPGNPTVVIQNMPGAGGLAAANYIAKVAAKDGTVLGALHANTTMAQVTGAPNVEYDAKALKWIGRISSSGLKVHYAWAKTGIDKASQLLDRPVIVGAGGATSESTVVPTVINQLMGGKLKILQGYNGTAETALALERGEIDVAYQSWEILRRNNADWLRDRKVAVLVQYDVARHAELPNVPAVMELASTQQQRDVWKLFLASGTIGHTLSAPPETPDDRVKALRAAFMAMSKDEGLAADAEKAGLQLEPMGGEELQKTVEAVFGLTAETIDSAKKILGR